MKKAHLAGVAISILLSSVFLSGAQQTVVTNTNLVVPPLINFSGQLTEINGKPLAGTVAVTFLLYKEPQGGSPIWMESQNLHTDSQGRYTVMLGSTSSTGLPTNIFAAGEAHWLGVQVQSQEEQPRVLLVSAPYALKAGDAQTLGGLPPSAFVLAAPPAGYGASVPAVQGEAATTSAKTVAPATSDVTTTGGTVNAVPLFTTPTNIQNSLLTQSGKAAINIVGKLNLPALGLATSTAGKNSQPQSFVASVFNSTTSTAVPQTFQWQAEPVGNDTATATGSLNLLFGFGTSKPAETGLSLASNGQITFATGQTFPGTGTVTSVGAGLGLTGGPITTTGTLAIDTTKIPQLGAANTFVGNQSITGNLSATGNLSGTEINASTEVLSNNNSTPALNVTNAVGNGINATGFVGVLGQTSFSGGVGVQGTAPFNGVWGQASSNGGAGVFGQATGGYGVWGNDSAASGSSRGVYGTSASTSGYGVEGSAPTTGVYGTATATSGTTYGVYGTASSPSGYGLYGSANAGAGLGAYNNSSTNATILASNNSTSNNAAVFLGSVSNPKSIFISAIALGAAGCGSNFYIGLQLGQSGMTNCTDYTVLGDGQNTFINAGSDVLGSELPGAIYFRILNNGSPNAMTISTNGSVSTGGNLSVGGNLSKKGGSFKVDHPLDPANKYLYHSFVESPDMMNIYNGVVSLDGQGEAMVELPEYFGALNRDFRYQLTPIGEPGPNLYIAEEIQNNQFKIAGGAPSAKVSWQVTGIRQDVWANAHRIPVEVEKDPQDRGHYLSPELYGQPATAGIGYGDPAPPEVHKNKSLLHALADRSALPAAQRRAMPTWPVPPPLPKLTAPPKPPAVPTRQVAQPPKSAR